ncbi:MAG: restriction endonuclease subunit S [Actinomycetota bacterium]
MAREWRDMEWGDLATLQYGKGLRGYENASGRYRVFGTNGPIGWHDEALSDHPTVVVGRKGAYRGIHYSSEPCFVIDTAFYLEPRVEFDMRWAYYELLTHDINSMDSGSAIPSTSRDAFYRLPIRVPVDLGEQRAIAHILGSLDDKIELSRRMNETLEGIARAIFKSWFVDFDPVRAKAEGRDPGLPKPLAALFPDRFVASDLGDIPERWNVITIGEACVVVDCLHSKKPQRQESGPFLLQLWNIRDDGLLDMRDPYCIDEGDYDLWVSRMEASPGDCVITNVGRVGAAAQVPSGMKAALGRNMTGLRCRPEFRYPTFLIQCLLSDAMRDEIALRTDSGTILDSLNVRNIPKLRCVKADDMVMGSLESGLRPIRSRMEQCLVEARTLAAVRDAVLPKLISGELPLGDAERLIDSAV